MKNLEELKAKAALVRKWCLISTTEAGSGHPTSCLSSADLMTVLFDRYFSYDIKNSNNPNNDRFILSKGHASPLLYTLYALAGVMPLEQLKTLRRIYSVLEGHPTPRFPHFEAATGSLGQGLSIGAGEALSAKKDNLLYKTYVLLGDGELAEGSIWEALNFASYYKLDNLIAVADINRFGQSQETMFGHRIEEYINRFSAFDWEVLAIDGHDFEEIEKAFDLAVHNKSAKPFVIVAKTKKGKGVSFLEDKDGWHGKVLKKEELEMALKELGNVDDELRFSLKAQNGVGLSGAGPAARFIPAGAPASLSGESRMRTQSAPAGTLSLALPAFNYKLGEEIATREVYGKVLAQIAKTNQQIYALDAEVKNSTYSQDFQKVFKERFIECFIAEQNMVGVAVGLSNRRKIPFVSTFAAFLTRAFDQIRMAGIGQANIKFVGSHAGVSIGEDGPSQMGLEDIALFGTIPNSIILHPSDAVSAVKSIADLVNHVGIAYLRTLRPKTPVIYGSKEEFPIGGSKILRSSKKDFLTVVAVGITVHEALKAYEVLKKENIIVQVVDCYSIKPIDTNTLQHCINTTNKQYIITVEDHYEHGGLGDFVLSAMSSTVGRVEKMAVNKIPRSGTKDELLDYAGISASHIVKKIKSLL